MGTKIQPTSYIQNNRTIQLSVGKVHYGGHPWGSHYTEAPLTPFTSKPVLLDHELQSMASQSPQYLLPSSFLSDL